MEETGRNLNIGSGHSPCEDWLNIDLRPFRGVGVVANWLALPFADESFDIINASQVLEHLSITQRGQALKEAWRVLKYAGELRIDVPDLARTCVKYLEGHKREAMAGFYGRPWEQGGGHQWGYDEERLNKLIWDAGFAVTEMRIEDMPLVPYIFLKARKTHGIAEMATEAVQVPSPCIRREDK